MLLVRQNLRAAPKYRVIKPRFMGSPKQPAHWVSWWRTERILHQATHGGCRSCACHLGSSYWGAI